LPAPAENPAAPFTSLPLPKAMDEVERAKLVSPKAKA
jgi:hypothetical protein